MRTTSTRRTRVVVRRRVRTTVVIGRRLRPTDVEREIARRIRAGEDAESFCCVDCGREHLDPSLCGCWDRGLF